MPPTPPAAARCAPKSSISLPATPAVLVVDMKVPVADSNNLSEAVLEHSRRSGEKAHMHDAAAHCSSLVPFAAAPRCKRSSFRSRKCPVHPGIHQPAHTAHTYTSVRFVRERIAGVESRGEAVERQGMGEAERRT